MTITKIIQMLQTFYVIIRLIRHTALSRNEVARKISLPFTNRIIPIKTNMKYPKIGSITYKFK